jgi:hypothetical protein
MYMIYTDSDGNVTMVYRTTDGAFIPPDIGNVDYLAYLAWVAEGNTAQPVA